MRLRNRVITALCSWLLICSVYAFGGFRAFDDFAEDLRFSLFPRPVSGDVVLVEIDARSIHDLQKWPWPRSLHGQAIDRLMEAGASRIAFDVDFSSEGLADREFADALARHAHKVVLPSFVQTAFQDGRMVLVQSDPRPEFARSALSASVNVFPDRSGRVENYEIGTRTDSGFKPSMGTMLAGGQMWQGQSFVLDFAIDIDSIPRLSFVDVLNNKFEPDMVQGKTILVGATAVELGDRYAVPRFGIVPGVLIQALGVETLTQATARQRIADTAMFAFLLLLSIALSFLLLGRSWRGAVVTFVTFATAVAVGTLAAQELARLWLPISPFLALIMVCAMIETGAELNERAARYLSARFSSERRRALFDQVVRSSADGVVVTDENGIIQSTNEAASDLLGLSGDEEVCLFDLLPEIDRTQFGRGSDMSVEGEVTRFPSVHCEVSSTALGVREIEIYGSRSRLTSSAGGQKVAETAHIISFVLRDVTEQNEMQRQIVHLSVTDHESKLPNRRALEEQIDSLQTDISDGHVACAALGIERFGRIRDVLGHQAANELVARVGRRMEEHADIVAHGRVASDMIGFLFSSEPGTDTFDAADAIRRSLEGSFEVIGETVDVLLTMGVADGSSELKIATLDQATVALQQAREQNLHVQQFDADAYGDPSGTLSLMSDMMSALEAMAKICK